MSSEKLTFVSFKPQNGRFVGFLSMESVISDERDLEIVLRNAAKIYERSIIKMSSILGEIRDGMAYRKPIPARKIWQIGQVIFQLRNKLEGLSLQLDGVYNHLVRDLGVKRKWLEKVVILRRYIPNKELIPKPLNWGKCEKGTRRIALKLTKGLPLD